MARLGVKPEASTGEVAAMMIKPLASSAEEFVSRVNRRFLLNLPVEQALEIRTAGVKPLVKAILGDTEMKSPVDLTDQDAQQDLRDIDSFVHHHRTLDTCIAALYRRVMALHKTKKQDIEPLLLDLVSGIARPTLCEKYNLSGDKALIKALRQAARPLLD